MAERDTESRDEKVLRYAERFERLTQLGLVPYILINPTFSEEDPTRIGIVLLTPDELRQLKANVRSRLRNDEFVMRGLGRFGVDTPLASPVRTMQYSAWVHARHFMNHPKARSAATPDEAFDLALEAHFDSQNAAEKEVEE